MIPGDCAGSAAERPPRDRAAALAAAACLAALLLHAYTAARPSLWTDDFTILLGSWTWADTRANLWLPLNEHVSPPTRLTTYAVVELAGRPSNLPAASMVVPRLALAAAVLLTYVFVRR